VVRAPRISTAAAGLPAPRTHLDHRGNIELLYQVLKPDRRLRSHAWILRADQIFKALRRSIVSILLLPALLGCGWGGNSGCSPCFWALSGASVAVDADSAACGLVHHSRGPRRRRCSLWLLRGSLRILMLFFRLDLAAVDYGKFGVSLIIPVSYLTCRFANALTH